MERSGNFYKAIRLGYILISILIGCMAYNSLYEWQEIEALELGNKKIDELRKEINNINIQMIKFSLLGETILEWNDKDIEHYHARRMAMDSMLCRFKATYPAERIDSVRSLLEDKERQMFQIVRLMDEQQSINKKIANQIPVIVQKSVQEQSKKPKRKGFLGIFGKKKEVTPAVSTTILHSVNRNVISEQKVQDRQLSEQADSLAARNAELNRQLQELICQIEEKVQTELQSRENEIVAMREKSFMQVGGLMGFVLLLLLISYIIIHRDAKSIKQYKHKTTDLIRQLEQSVQRNEALITSRKKAVHTITHELRTPLTAITGYAGLIRKEQCEDKSGQYIQNILQSSDRMREMLNTLLNFFRLDNGKEQPNFSACRISAITHTLETEFMPIAINKGLTLTIHCHKDAFVCTDKERILQIGNNLLSNAIKFTENGGVSLTTDYNNGVLKLIVEDTGTGMTEEEQQRIFGAFERLSNAAAKDGFGLGLSIVQRIVTMLGGTIRLESDKGKGSRFTVEIPMQTAGEQPERINQTRIHHNHRFHDVIAIDNDEVLLLMLKEMYAQEGIHCDTCTNAAELMEMIRRKEYNLLLTDLNMPEINGFELLELLRTSNVGNSKTIPVVVTTASSSCSKEELMERGFAGCLLKPFSISELMEVSDKCAIKGKQNEKPDFTFLLSYGNEAVMLDKLITETEKEMQSVRDAEQRKDLQELDALTHHLRSSWEILRADQPLRELYKLLHYDGTPDDKTIGNAVKAVLDKGSEIIRLAKEERRKYENG
ncbi:ATP-binding protein [Bacteroides fragilis]|uniref:histidine kinase n=2 Tax=Bacteroidales TaxID=171549 RepID=A0A9Q4JFQ5_BACFG|nr:MULTISPECIES: ATP-binding protein [Bacteroides]MCZ2613675.1 ATP-binding protein [Bacteroides fragilis]MCZ2689040.1 ATP-binding protein [Bacteroides fragilis]UVQ12148.1 ATP-binding protein [Bacteroides xylanisolvens]